VDVFHRVIIPQLFILIRKAKLRVNEMSYQGFCMRLQDLPRGFVLDAAHILLI
jgi:hypothetical protein